LGSRAVSAPYACARASAGNFIQLVFVQVPALAGRFTDVLFSQFDALFLRQGDDVFDFFDAGCFFSKGLILGQNLKQFFHVLCHGSSLPELIFMMIRCPVGRIISQILSVAQEAVCNSHLPVFPLYRMQKEIRPYAKSIVLDDDAFMEAAAPSFSGP